MVIGVKKIYGGGRALVSEMKVWMEGIQIGKEGGKLLNRFCPDDEDVVYVVSD